MAKKIALLIGVGEFGVGLKPLRCPANGVTALREVLENPQVGGFDEVIPLLNPDVGTMQRQVGEVFARAQKDDLLLFYFTGHGVKDLSGDFYFATRETELFQNGSLNIGTAVDAKLVLKVMANSLCRRQVAILDCCFSGAFPDGFLAMDADQVDIRGQLGGEGRAVLTAATSTKYALEQEGEALSVYTRYLVEGLRTGAAAPEGASEIAMRPLHDYVREKVQTAAPAMRPEIYAARDGEQIVIARAAADDPVLRYRKRVNQYIEEGEIGLIGRRILNRLRLELGLTEAQAQEIEAAELKPHRERRDNLREFGEAVQEAAQHYGGLTDRVLGQLREFQRMLNLRDEDVEPMLARVPRVAHPVSEPLPTPLPEPIPPPQPKVRITEPIPTSPTRKPQVQVRLPEVRLPQWTRRKFLTVVGFGGAGFVGTVVMTRLLQFGQPDKQPPTSSSPSLRPSSSTLPPSPETDSPSQPPVSSGGSIKVGILHSLSGTMAISEKSVVDAEMLAIEEINNAGGILGNQIEPITEDGASDWPTFAEKAKKLIIQDRVATVFGCWTSASRKSVLPIFESQNHLLWYPVQYEGQECSKNIFYTGAVLNQGIEPSVQWLLANKGKEFFLVGSDYVFPSIANTIIKAQLKALSGAVVGEDYISLGNTEITPLISKIKVALPNGGVIYNTFNGDTNIAFFKALQDAGMRPDKYPTMSVGISEEEVQAIGVEYLKGQYAVWNYFQTVNTPSNKKFVSAFKDKYGSNRVVNDPMEAAYIAVYLWKQAVEKAGTVDDLVKVKKAAYGQTFDAPEGMVTLETNHHLSKFVRIGEVQDNGLFKIIYETKEAIKPQPWNQFLPETKGYICDWSDPAKGAKYKGL
ncbi:urea ABC transporter substrate-binding protein [Alkalinema pantanalense CENA528]|uniref:urea ABC transporter substrate-binding protein n=1 Tax=Alkalinema pantanalense TaxID=1620705 RepID=UPI003D6FEEFC